MRKLVSLAIALFFVVAAAAQNLASQKITQTVVKGSLEQTVFAGDEIKPVRIVYENTGLADNESPEYSSSDFLTNFGLTKRWTGQVCEISGQMRDDIAAGTYDAYIVVKDDEGKFAKTEFKFIVKEKALSLEWLDQSGPVNQSVKAGNTITPIVFNYAGIKSYSVSGLPDGLMHRNDEKNQRILIVGSVNSNALSGDYEYTVTVKNDQGDEASKSGTITVEESKAETDIKVVENETQKVVAGSEIKPIVFVFKNVHVSGGNFPFRDEGSLKGQFKYVPEDNKLTVSGTVAENLEDGYYTIRMIVDGENNSDTAVASVEVTHKLVVTRVTVLENETQTLTAGDSIKPIVFQIEHGSDPQVKNFPGGYQVQKEGNKVTVIGLVEESAKGPYDIVLSVTGVDNNASAKATINVIDESLKIELVEGSDNQTVVAGQDIVPIVYHYYFADGAECKKFPANLSCETYSNRVKISGAVDSKSAPGEYVYMFDVTDLYGAALTVTGKINVIANEQSSSSVASSSSENIASSSSVASSSSAEESSSSSATSSSSEAASSSSEASSSSSAVESSSSSVEKLSSSSEEKQSSSSAEKLSSSSSEETSSSSETTKPTSSSSAKSSSSEKSASSSSKTTSSSSAKSSSSGKSKSSSSTSESSSSSKKGKSSSSDNSPIIASVVPSFKFGYANNELTVVLPKAAMVRVQVFDLMGHVVETFAESVVSSKNFNLAHLKKGNYIVRVESSRFARSAKVAVK